MQALDKRMKKLEREKCEHLYETVTKKNNLKSFTSEQAFKEHQKRNQEMRKDLQQKMERLG